MLFVVIGAGFEDFDGEFDVAIGQVLGEVEQGAPEGGEFGFGREETGFLEDEFRGEAQGFGELAEGGFVGGSAIDVVGYSPGSQTRCTSQISL